MAGNSILTQGVDSPAFLAIPGIATESYLLYLSVIVAKSTRVAFLIAAFNIWHSWALKVRVEADAEFCSFAFKADRGDEPLMVLCSFAR